MNAAPLARHTPRLFRLAILAAVAGLLYAAAIRPRPPDNVSLAAAKTFFPKAERLSAGDPRLGGQTVLDEHGRTLGLVLTTSPHTDDIIGYAGPSNLLIALDASQRVIGVQLLASGDTQAHVDEVRKSDSFWKQFAGASPAAEPPKVEGVSGSTLTSLAMAEAIERRLGGSVLSLRFPEPVTLIEVQTLFPAASRFTADDPRGGWHRAMDAQGQTLGYAVRTSPYTDNGRGYRGPTESLVAVGADGRTVVGFVMRRSYDTPEYVDRVRDDEGFRRLLAGRTIDEWSRIDFASEGIEGVSGATQTSFAVADGMRRRFAADVAAAGSGQSTLAIHPGLLAVIGGGLAMTFTPLRANRRLRIIWQGVLIVVFLFWLGDLVSLALLVGWARHGVPWQTAPSVVLLVAVALVVPWTTRRHVYCQQLCPHGAAQTWLGQFKRLHVRIPPAWQRWLSRFPAALLVVGLVLAMYFLTFDLAWLEPFDGWVLKGAAAVSAAIAVIGLIVSVFVPQAYCRYGCPTGELLRFAKSGGNHDRLQRRDLVAGGLVLLGATAVFGPGLVTSPTTAPQQIGTPSTNQFSGEAFGTTWSVKLRGQHDVAALRTAVAAELERIESTLSHWRPESYTSQFNASETTLETEQPAELVALVARSLALSRLSGGAYDITVAPLVDAWGYGPSGEKTAAPTDEQIAELLGRVGWEKLAADPANSTLRKGHPQLRIDLGSLLQGYAADRVAKVLDEAHVAEYLIDVGGELFARGSWQVAIEDPRDSARPLRTLVLKDGGMATSGLYRAAKQLDSTTAHHLISPHTGRPIAATATLATVIAPTAIEADAWATALLAVGLPDALKLADEQELSVLLVNSEQRTSINSEGAQLFDSNGY